MELNCRVVGSLLSYFKEKYGGNELENFILNTGMQLEYLEDEDNWISYDYMVHLLEELVKYTNDPRAPFKAGTNASQKGLWKILRTIYVSFGTIGSAYKLIVSTAPKFNKIGRYDIIELGKNRIKIEARFIKEGYKQNRNNCLNMQGHLCSVPTLWGLPLADIKEIQCAADGAESCIYELVWGNKPGRSFGIVGIVCGFFVLLIIHLVFLNVSIPLAIKVMIGIAIPLLGYFIGRSIDYKNLFGKNSSILFEQERNKALMESMEKIENLYASLHQKVEELKESEEQYRTTFESTGTAIAIIEEDMTVSMANTEFEKLVGHPTSGSGGMLKWTDFANREDLEMMKEYYQLQRKLPEHSPFKYETKLRNLEGKLKDVLIFLTMLPRTEKCVVSFIDITTQKRTSDILSSISAVATKVQTLLSPDEIYLTMTEELEKLGLQNIVLRFSEDQKIAWIEHFSFSQKLLQILESLTGIRKDSFIIEVDRVPQLKEMIEKEVPILALDDPIKSVGYFIPKIAKPAATRIISIINVDQSVYTPIILDNRIIGTIILLSRDSIKPFLPALPVFSAQISNALKNAEMFNRIRRSEENYRKLFNSTADAIIILDKEGKIVDVNPALVEIFGYKQPDLINQPLVRLMDSSKNTITDFENYISRIHREGSEKFEIWYRRKNGESFPAEMTLAMTVYNGEKAIITSLRDVSEKKRIEEEQRQHLVRTEALLELSKLDISNLNLLLKKVTEVDGRTLNVERVSIWLFNEDRTEFICQDLFRVDLGKHERGAKLDVKQYPGYFRALMESRIMAVYDVHTDSRTKELSEVYFKEFGINSVMDVPVWLHGEVVGIVCHGHVGTFRQWTLEEQDFAAAVASTVSLALEAVERRRAEETLRKTVEELAKSNRELEQFAYVSSHDLQEPLRMVGSYTQLLARRYKGKLDSEADEFIRYAVEGVKRMQILINDLLTFSRIGTRGKPFEATDCNVVLKKTLQDLKVSIEENNAEVIYDSLPTVYADEIQLGQLFQNLIGNAIKFRSKENPKIHISAKLENEQWVVSVKDNGIGIESQYKDRIFVIFQRLHTRNEYPGTGIGLAVCKKIVERHGGKIWLESEVGKGTTFYFTLPPLDKKNL